MSDELIPLSHHLTALRPANSPIAYHAGRYYDVEQFSAAVKSWVTKLQAQPFQRYALYAEDTYPFAVMLFALFHAGKEAWIPGNNCPGTAQQLQQQACQLLGDWDKARPFDYGLEMAESSTDLSPLNPAETRLVIFTSGSTGQPKPIEKRLSQLQIEITTLEKLWGGWLAGAEALATVSHQHLYGLLFRLLWPLSAGRCFHSQIYLNPEMLVNSTQNAAYWVASPAHLKRLDQDSPWEKIAGLNAIFSSGGPLQHNAAQQVLACSGQSVIEIYGSSETGGIAWRQQGGEPVTPWALFEGMALTRTDDAWHLHSSYLTESGSDGFQLADQISLQEDGRFLLHGRLDRIVKIEEKRLSLTELEQRLMDTPWIADAFTVMIEKGRDVVGAFVVLNQDGLQLLEAKGRNQLIKQIRTALSQWFEAVVLPRKWLFTDRIPMTAQGKVERHLLMQLLNTESRKFPQVHGFTSTYDRVELDVKVPTELVYFPDHFDGFPILPGVVQIAWAEHFGKLFFAINESFSQMEIIKFVKIIQPEDEIKLALKWDANTGQLSFNFSSEQGVHSSGRMVYGEKR
ncbi:MAG: AMP-binding protein [Methylobacter sp.]|jgi:acyl-coenzyme A synthetase/AMP-(fatty) acid ligase